jgi:undecaprenyl pyrophosphate phosphatase UppP
MATPIVAGAGIFELRRLLTGEFWGDVNASAVTVGFAAAALSGLVAIHVPLRFARSHAMSIFVTYRLLLAALVLVVLLAA